MSTTAEFGRGKTIFVLAIVIGCFAVLWPKIFYPMLTASIGQTSLESVPTVPRPRKGGASTCCDVISEKDTNAYQVMNEICMNILRKDQMIQQQQPPPSKSKKGSSPPVKVSTATLCRNEIKQTCGVDIVSLLQEDHSITTEYKKSLGQLRTFNTSLCMKMNYGVDFTDIGLQRKIKGPDIVPSHVRQERPFRPGPDMVHPALRERGRAIPTVSIPRRTIEREARPGPVPGMRPPVGGAGHIPTGPKGGGTMGIIMPMYTIGIVCFFLYTIMKILFKKPPEAEQVKPAPQVKDYGLDPEHRKYVFSEEYAEGSERSLREPYNKEDRDLGVRRRPSGGKSARFFEDRRRLESPSIIYPTYPSDLETKDSSETTPPPPPLTSAPETDTPTTTTTTSTCITKESIEIESKTPDAPIITDTNVISSAEDDTKMTDVIEQFPPKAESPVTVFSPTTDNNDALNISLSHEQPETSSVLNEIEDQPVIATKISMETKAAIPLEEMEIDDRPSLSRDESVASSADTIIAESTLPMISEIEDAAAKKTSDIEGTTTSVRKQSSVVSPSDSGPFSPLAPEQTPNLEGEEFHFFDRTIVIPDYEPADPEAAKLAADQTSGPLTGQEEGPSQLEKEVEEMSTEEIIIVKDVPQNVLDLASQVAEKILDAAKLESIAVDEEAQNENVISVAAPTPSPAGESLSMISEPVSDCSRLSQQPRLSLDTNITALLDSATNAAAVVHEPTDTTAPLTKSCSSDDSTTPSVEPSATGIPPEIQVETPHADQTELNKIAEYLETLNTEPKETEKLAAVPLPEDKPEIISPIVTLAEECAGGAARSSSSGSIPTKSKIEITPFDDIQPPASMLDKLGLGDLPDICYVTQPLDENQKGRDRTQFLKSRIEIVSLDESLPTSEPVMPASLPVEKERKTSEPIGLVAGSLLGQDLPPVTESLEEAVKKLRHVPVESSALEQKEKKVALRKASTSSDHSQLTDSPKPSEIDKYVDRVANLQESRKAMIEREMFRSSQSQSSQGSDAVDQQQSDQSSNFHGPGLLDSGQIPEIDCHESPPPVSDDNTEDDFLDKMKEVQKWAENTTTVLESSKGSREGFEENQRYSSNDSEKQSGSEEGPLLSRHDSENVQLFFGESLEKEESDTKAIYTSVDLPPSEEVVKLVSTLIDQALSQGTKEAAEIVSLLHEQDKNERLVSNIGKLDQVLEEIGCCDDSGLSGSNLHSVLSRELKSEIQEMELLKDFIEEQIEGVDSIVAGTTDTIESNINDPEQTDLELGSLTEHHGKQFTNESNTLQDTEPPFSTIIPTTSTTADITTLINNETQSIRRPSTTTKTGTSIDESNNLVGKITEECEIISAAIATTTPSQASNTTSSNAPTTVDSCLPLSEPTSSSLPNDSIITTPPVPPVIESHENQEGAKGEESRQDGVNTEDQEPILAELETIQEEMEHLSSQLERMESENICGEKEQSQLTCPAEQGESVSLKESSDEKQGVEETALAKSVQKTGESIVKSENDMVEVEKTELLKSEDTTKKNDAYESAPGLVEHVSVDSALKEQPKEVIDVVPQGEIVNLPESESQKESATTFLDTATKTGLTPEEKKEEVEPEVVVKQEIVAVSSEATLKDDSKTDELVEKDSITTPEIVPVDMSTQIELMKPKATEEETKEEAIGQDVPPVVKENQKDNAELKITQEPDETKEVNLTQESVQKIEESQKTNEEEKLLIKSEIIQEQTPTEISPQENQKESIKQDASEPEAGTDQEGIIKQELSSKLDVHEDKLCQEITLKEESQKDDAQSEVPSTTAHELSSKTEQYVSPQTEPEISPKTEPEISPKTEPEISPKSEPEISPKSEPEISPKTEPEISPKTEQYVSPQTEPEISPKTEQYVSPQTEPEISPKAEQYVSPQTESEMSPTTEQSLSPKTEPDLSPTTEQELSPKTEQELSPKTEQELSPKTEPDLSPTTEQELSPKTEQDLSPKTEQEMSPKTEVDSSESEQEISPQAESETSPKTEQRQADTEISPETTESLQKENVELLPKPEDVQSSEPLPITLAQQPAEVEKAQVVSEIEPISENQLNVGEDILQKPDNESGYQMEHEVQEIHVKSDTTLQESITNEPTQSEQSVLPSIEKEIHEQQQETVEKESLPSSQIPEKFSVEQATATKVSEGVESPLAEESVETKGPSDSPVRAVIVQEDKKLAEEHSEQPLQEMKVSSEEIISKPEAVPVTEEKNQPQESENLPLSSDHDVKLLTEESEEQVKVSSEASTQKLAPQKTDAVAESIILASEEMSASVPQMETVVSSDEMLEKGVPVPTIDTQPKVAGDVQNLQQSENEVETCPAETVEPKNVSTIPSSTTDVSNEDVKSEPAPQTIEPDDSPTSSTTPSISESSIVVVSDNLVPSQPDVPQESVSKTGGEQAAVTQAEQNATPAQEEENQVVQTAGGNLSSSVAPLRFEILTEPPFPLLPTTTEPLSQPESSTLQSDTENNITILNTTSSSPLPDTITIISSCGIVVDNSSDNAGQPQHQSSGASMALTVELLDEHSPEIFPLPSTISNIATTTSSTSSPPPTSPVEKAQQSEKELMSSSILNAGVSLSADATDQASTINASRSTTTATSGVEVTAEKQATQAPSAVKSTSCTTPNDDGQVVQEFANVDQLLSITDESGESVVPSSPAPPPPTPAVSSVPPSFPISSKSDETSIPPQPAQQIAQKDEGVDDEANKESGLRERDAIVTAVKGIVEAFDATKTSSLSKSSSPPPPATKTEGKAATEEDLEKLIASAEKTSAVKKEDLGSAPPTETQLPSPSVIKPAVAREKREKSSEKEVKFKLPPEEVEVDEEEEEYEEEEEVEIVRPPTPPKTLSKAKTKSPDSPTSPEPLGYSTTSTTHAPLLTSSSSHRTHDELLISGMQTTVAGSAAGISVTSPTPTNNHSISPSPAALIADCYNNTTIPSETVTPTISNTSTFSHRNNDLSPITSAQCDDSDDAKEQRTITETITVVKNHDDDDNNDQSAAAAIAQAKAAGYSGNSASPTPGVSVVGIEETASLITGERWELTRTPTPTFRQPTPPVPHRPPTPPDQIPSIYLEGPMTVKGQEIVVKEAQTEVEGDDYDYDDDYEPSGPVILSGKVTLSVISSVPGATPTHDEVTEAPSLSLDDRAQAEHSRGRSSGGGASSRKTVETEIASAIKEQVRGKSDGKKSSNASSPDMDEYEVIGKGGFEHDDDDAADVSLDDFLTATDADQELERAQEDTAADISTMDDLKQEQLPKDEE